MSFLINKGCFYAGAILVSFVGSELYANEARESTPAPSTTPRSVRVETIAGNEWEDPLATRINAEPFRTNMAVPKGDAARSLNGLWKFHWVPTPEQRPKDFYKMDYDVSAWKTIPVPSSWQLYGYGTPHYSNVDFPFKVNPPYVMGEPPKNFVAYKERNPVGSYVTTLDVNPQWNRGAMFLRFDGVDAGFYLWINGKYVGYSEDSYTGVEFNVTPFLTPGKNKIAVECYRFTDGSYLEDQDFFRFSGIFRDVTLFTTPKLNITDFFVRAGLKDTYQTGTLDADITVYNYDTQNSSTPTRATLKIAGFDQTFCQDVAVPSIPPADSVTLKIRGEIPKVHSWNAEEPNLYAASLQLENIAQSRIDFKTGFRTVEIGPSGELLINGRETILKGVNRHEAHPDLGRAITREIIQNDIEIAKSLNINMIRTSHYPNQPCFYEMCDSYGMYVCDEANCEAHGSRHSKNDISRIPSFKKAHIERNMSMVHRTKNSPSVIFHSLGNESGRGPNFDAVSDAIRAYDTTRLLHHCDYLWGDKHVDMDANMYPPLSNVINTGNQPKNHRPYFACEYAHSMGNATGNLCEYVDAFEKYPRNIGGCIWDFVDQSIRADRKPDGKYKASPFTGKTFAYGGMFGDAPTQHNFCDNGILLNERILTAKCMEVKYAYQPARFEFQNRAKGELRFTNKFYHKTMKNYRIRVRPFEGKMIHFPLPETASRASTMLILPADVAQQRFTIELLSPENTVVAQQFFERAKPITVTWQKSPSTAPQIVKDNLSILVKSGKIQARFEKGIGLKSVKINEHEMIQNLKMQIFRAPVDNDGWKGGRENWMAHKMQNLGAKCTRMEIQENSIICDYETTGAKILFHYRTTYTFHENTIYVSNVIEPQSAETTVARMGFTLQIPLNFDKVTYLGKGPFDTYVDRQRHASIDYYSTTVSGMSTRYSRPQECMNRMDVERIMFTDTARGESILFESASPNAPLNASASYYTPTEIDKARSLDQLPIPQRIWVNIDAFQMPLGGASCGPRPLPNLITYTRPIALGYVISFLGSTTMPHVASPVIPHMPLITRNSDLEVSLSSPTPEATIFYTLDSASAQRYTQPFKCVQGNITAWCSSPDGALISAHTSRNFSHKTAASQIKVIAVSSEHPEGNQADKAIDQDPNTFWQSAFKNALPNYPHDFALDLGASLKFNGFIYVPRNDGNLDGVIGGYRLYISDDGNQWKEIEKGKFKYNMYRKEVYEQRVKFKKTYQARYLKFEATEPAVKGHPWATMAEFSLLEVNEP